MYQLITWLLFLDLPGHEPRLHSTVSVLGQGQTKSFPSTIEQFLVLCFCPAPQETEQLPQSLQGKFLSGSTATKQEIINFKNDTNYFILLFAGTLLCKIINFMF